MFLILFLFASWLKQNTNIIFHPFMCSYLILVVNDSVGLDDNDDDETVAVEHKRVRRESSLALRKLGNVEGGTKPKKKARVLVEVRIYDKLIFFFFLHNQLDWLMWYNLFKRNLKISNSAYPEMCQRSYFSLVTDYISVEADNPTPSLESKKIVSALSRVHKHALAFDTWLCSAKNVSNSWESC